MASRWRVPLSDFVRESLAHDLLRLLEHEPGARRFDPEGIHHMRTSTRRLRSNLRFFEPALDATWARSLRQELRWLADLLGQVRDLDVLEQHLRDDLSTLPGSGNGQVPLPAELRASVLGQLQTRQKAARLALAEALDGDQYARLRSRLIAAARSPEPGPEANRPAHTALPRMLRRSWRRFVRHANELGPDSPVEAYHDLRKRAKRTRYAAEVGALAPSRRIRRWCRRHAELATRVQDILGQMQDAVVESEFLSGTLEKQSGTSAPDSVRPLVEQIRERKFETAREEFNRCRHDLNHCVLPA